VVILLGLGIALLWKFSEITLITVALAYLVSGLLARIAYGIQRSRRLRTEGGA
jgi:CDP-diacylglycerol--serine O-phosphatidyltransferase